MDVAIVRGQLVAVRKQIELGRTALGQGGSSFPPGLEQEAYGEPELNQTVSSYGVNAGKPPIALGEGRGTRFEIPRLSEGK
jgi:hypothetical protein